MHVCKFNLSGNVIISCYARGEGTPSMMASTGRLPPKSRKGTQQIFVRGGSAPRSNPLTVEKVFYICDWFVFYDSAGFQQLKRIQSSKQGMWPKVSGDGGRTRLEELRVHFSFNLVLRHCSLESWFPVILKPFFFRSYSLRRLEVQESTAKCLSSCSADGLVRRHIGIHLIKRVRFILLVAG